MYIATSLLEIHTVLFIQGNLATNKVKRRSPIDQLAESIKICDNCMVTLLT